jgi:hypothetical protein
VACIEVPTTSLLLPTVTLLGEDSLFGHRVVLPDAAFVGLTTVRAGVVIRWTPLTRREVSGAF